MKITTENVNVIICNWYSCMPICANAFKILAAFEIAFDHERTASNEYI